jgi:hypothetical protein
MSSGSSNSDQASGGAQERQAEAGSQDSTEGSGQSSQTQPSGPSSSRSVSIDYSHENQPDQHANHETKFTTEGYFYPSPTGGFAPKGRPPTAEEVAYMSDAPHLDYRNHIKKRNKFSPVPKSPRMSHLRLPPRQPAAGETTGGPSREAAAAAAAAAAEENTDKESKENIKKD